MKFRMKEFKSIDIINRNAHHVSYEIDLGCIYELQVVFSVYSLGWDLIIGIWIWDAFRKYKLCCMFIPYFPYSPVRQLGKIKMH